MFFVVAKNERVRLPTTEKALRVPRTGSSGSAKQFMLTESVRTQIFTKTAVKPSLIPGSHWYSHKTGRKAFALPNFGFIMRVLMRIMVCFPDFFMLSVV